ncbi:hypothetical protein BH11MYX1_BH11MYX1_01820 [soil metagenome]
MACVALGTWLGADRVDYSRQLALFTRGCDLGNMLGCTNLGAILTLDLPEWRANQASRCSTLHASATRCWAAHGFMAAMDDQT